MQASIHKLLISASSLWIDEAIKLARSYGARVRPAHIDRESNGIVAILGDIPKEYGFSCFEFRDADKIAEYEERFDGVLRENVLVCSDAHHLWDINEAEFYVELDDEPYSSSLVRKRFFEFLDGLEDKMKNKNN